MLDGFKKFILRGNVVDMAVGVVIGAAFGGVVTELTKAFLTPLIALIVGKQDYSNLKFVVRTTTFPVGEFVNALHLVRVDRGRGLLLCGRTDELAHRAHAQAGGSGGSDDKEMPRVPERDSDRGEAVFALHAAGHGKSCLVSRNRATDSLIFSDRAPRTKASGAPRFDGPRIDAGSTNPAIAKLFNPWLAFDLALEVRGALLLHGGPRR